MNGDIEDPVVSINPLSIFTPGILRDIFQTFELPFKESRDESLQKDENESLE